MSAADLYRAGRLQEAIDAALAEVKAKPSDTGCRSFLCELLCFSGAIDRADKQLDTLSQLSPELGVAIASRRHVLRAAKWRQQFFEEGRLPEFAGKPSRTVEQHLEATILLREGKHTEAAALLREALDQSPPVHGVCNGGPFDGLRDLDDVIAPVLEVYTANGKYYWIAWEQVASMQLEPVRHPRDVLWRPARVTIRNGPEGEVFLPALYHASDRSADDAVRLGRSTTWEAVDDGSVRGLGQKMLLAGDTEYPFLEITNLATDSVANAT
jgi:type VI secretion system protein ImpE